MPHDDGRHEGPQRHGIGRGVGDAWDEEGVSRERGARQAGWERSGRDRPEGLTGGGDSSFIGGLSGGTWGGAMDQTMLLVGLTAVGGGFVKGGTGMAFPLFATPVLVLLTDIRTAIVVLLAPNILMDAVQIVRKRFPLEHLKRLWPMLAAGIFGVFLGTY